MCAVQNGSSASVFDLSRRSLVVPHFWYFGVCGRWVLCFGWCGFFVAGGFGLDW